MDGHQHEGMNDAALEREIEAAFGVDPSPEFLPRVRARIASERVREGWLASRPWQWASVAAGVAAVVVVGLWIVREPAPTPEAARLVTPQVVEPPPSAPEVVAVAGEPARPVVTAVVHRAPTPQATASFEVLISQDEAAAWKRLFAAISERRIETKSLPDLAAALKPPDPIDEIALEPITISPLAALEGE